MGMKFLADMGVSPRCVEWLRSQGHNAVHLHEQNLHRSSDYDVLRKARAEERILLTMDLDFAQLISAARFEDIPVVVIFRLTDQRPHNVQKRLSVIIEMLENLSIQEKAIISVGDEKIRIRRLPIK